MFILENPYVSNLLLETLENNQFKILRNPIAAKYSSEYNLNIIDENDAKKFCQTQKDLKIYSNSENSINWVLENCKNSDIAKLINISKNKYDFRKSLKSVYPNFFFKEVLLENIDNVDITDFPEQFIIKPSIGFLSMGVHKVSSHSEWKDVVALIKAEVEKFAEYFPAEVLSSSTFIAEEIIQGEEFAIDTYFNNDGKPVILNIFQHPFVSEDDVSDRAYISSKEIIEANLKPFEKLLSDIGAVLGIKNFPMHIEVIKSSNGKICPVEINPMRFAGWCTTDLAYYAYGINVYEYFFNNLEPDWNKILEGKDGKTYYFAMIEAPDSLEKDKISFDYDLLKKSFSNILEFRKINYLEKPLFAIIFGETQRKEEITEILQLEVNDFVKSSAAV